MEKFNQFKRAYDTFTGFIGTEIEAKYFDSGNCKVKFAIPLRENKEDEATWLNCVIWNKPAEALLANYKKGDNITVIGQFKTDTYNDKETGELKEYTYFNVKIAQ